MSKKHRKTSVFLIICLVATVFGACFAYIGQYQRPSRESVISTSADFGDINKMTAEDFQRIQGVGEELSKRIVEYREKVGKLNSIDELKNIQGIGDKKLAEIKDKLNNK